MPDFFEIIVAILVICGTFLMVVAGVGLLRFPDVYCRMHAAGKAGTLGIVLIILGVVVAFAPHDPGMALRGILAIFFQFLTVPAATHLLARASYISDYPIWERTAVDELQSYLPSRPDEVTWSE